MEHQTLEIYETPQGSKHTLNYKPGYNQYYFKRDKGKIHKSLDTTYTSRREANKAWVAYVNTHMKYNRTSKNVDNLGEKESPDFKLKKPVKVIEQE